jgi:hypothetical protein
VDPNLAPGTKPIRNARAGEASSSGISSVRGMSLDGLRKSLLLKLEAVDAFLLDSELMKATPVVESAVTIRIFGRQSRIIRGEGPGGSSYVTQSLQLEAALLSEFERRLFEIYGILRGSAA